MKNGHTLRSIDSSFKQRYSQYYLPLNTSLLSVLESYLLHCPCNCGHKNNRPIPPELTETASAVALVQVMHILGVNEHEQSFPPMTAAPVSRYGFQSKPGEKKM